MDYRWTNRTRQGVLLGFLLCAMVVPSLAAAQSPGQAPAPAPGEAKEDDDDEKSVFKLGELVTVVGTAGNVVGIGGAEITATELRTFDRTSLEQAVNLVPGVTSTLDSRGPRNESDVFVRGFGRW